MEYAIIESGGKQYKVSPGTTLDIEKVSNAQDTIIFDKVLLHVSSGSVKIGTPYVSGFKVQAKIIGQKRGEKIRISKFKAKSKYRRSIGFRHSLLTIEILPFEGKTSKKVKEK